MSGCEWFAMSSSEVLSLVVAFTSTESTSFAKYLIFDEAIMSNNLDMKSSSRE